ncbi:lactonase family protein [Opitutia bacterium ISCC 51]|nr:lactonase family protein [Opitutae bacterium ISCC 51]QXD30295.1 lactonase family protein [Opitutae bacterium ISCC 52]
MNKLLPLISLLISPLLMADSIDVFFGTAGNQTKGIYHSTFDTETGKLGQPSLAAEIGSPGFLAFGPDKEFLYTVGNDGEPCVAAYKVGEGGKLTALNTEPIGDGGGAHISVYPSKKFLLTAQYGGGSVAVFPINKDGSVGKRSQLIEHEGGSGVVESRQKSPHPHWTGYSPDGKFAFVPDLGLDQIVIYKVDERKGSISHHGHAQSVPGGGPRHMKFSTDGKYIYLLNELTLSVTTFAYNAKAGTTERRTTTPALSEDAKARQEFNSSAQILVHPNGKFVYSSNRGDDSVTLYWANQKSGHLAAKDVENVRGAFPRNINLDPEGNWLLTAGQHSNTVTVFAIDQKTGQMSHQVNNTINVPGPICILFKE